MDYINKDTGLVVTVLSETPTVRRRVNTPSMVTASDKEIAAWNEEVERRKAAKKGVDRGI